MPDRSAKDASVHAGGVGTLPQRFSWKASFFLKSVIFVVLAFLDPVGCAGDGARLIEARHSAELIWTTLVRFLAPRCGRSVVAR